MSLGELATEPRVPVGTRVFVEEDGIIYSSVGQTRPEIASYLGWKQPNIWLPSHAMRRIQTRHKVILSPVIAASMVLEDPLSIHVGYEPNHAYFICDATALRTVGTLTSQTTRWIDLVVESRQAFDGRRFLRTFHLSPATRNKGGKQLWP